MEEEQGHVIEAIRRLREGLRWRPEKDTQHLAKGIELGHLAVGTTLAEYEAIIMRVISIPTAEVFVYHWGERVYPTVVAELEGARWLVMFDLDGMMETAFPPEDPERYLANLRFQRRGTLEELGV
jgi:hypothetical protein